MSGTKNYVPFLHFTNTNVYVKQATAVLSNTWNRSNQRFKSTE